MGQRLCVILVKELFARLGLEVDAESFERGESLMESLTEGWKGVALGAAAVVGAMFEVARETAEAGEEAAHAAAKLGITTDAYQELAGAAYLAGVSVEGLEGALFKMERASFMAKQGSQQAAQAFQGLVSLKDLKTLKPDELFTKMADGLVKIQDPGARAAKLTQIFGRGVAANLIPLLNKGSEGINELKDKFRELGGVQSEEAIKLDEEFNESMRESVVLFKGYRNALGNWLIPRMLEFGRGVKNVVKGFNDWRKAHVEGIFQTIKFGLIALTSVFVAWVATQTVGLTFLIEYYGTLGWAALVTGAKMALGWLIAIAPLAAVALGIAVILLWVEDLYQFLTGGQSLIGDFFQSLSDGFTGPDGVKGVIEGFVYWLLQFFPDQFAIAGQKAAGKLVDALEPVGKFMKKYLTPGGVIDTVKSWNGDAPGVGGGFQGGATSPAASVSASPNAAVPGSAGKPTTVQTNNIVVNTHPGMSGDEVVGSIQKHIDDHHEKINRESIAAAP